MSEKRYEVIDAFRGVAVLSVMTFHFLIRWAPPKNPANLYGYRETFSPLFAVGSLGVDLFFVISGFVIAMTVLRSQDAIEFMARRIARLWPALIVAALVTFAVTSFAPIAEFKTSLTDLFASFTLDPADLHHRAVDGAYWSLAWEIKFYLLVALAFYWWDQRFWIPIVALGIVAVAWRELDPGHADKFLIARFFPLFVLGIGGWLISTSRRKEGLIVALIAIALCFVQMKSYLAIGAPRWASIVYLFGGVCLMFGLLATNLSFGPLTWIGRISYSLYLIHQFLGVVLIRWLVQMGLPDLMAAGLVALGCISLAAILFHTVEQEGQRIILRAYFSVRTLVARSWRERPASQT